MEDEQRSIYEAYRNDYRNQILGTIETQGIHKISAYHFAGIDEASADL
jgi:hypothetical protein